MKKSIFGKIGAAAVVLTLVTSSLVGGTFAKYVTNASAKANVTVASWGVTFNKDENASFDNQTITLGGEGKKIFPGAKGQIDVLIKGDTAEVGFDYTIKISKDNGSLEHMKFYSDSARTKEISSETGLTGILGYGEKDGIKSETVSIYWELPEGAGAAEGASADDKDVADTAMAGQSAEYTISMNASQHVEKSE